MLLADLAGLHPAAQVAAIIMIGLCGIAFIIAVLKM